MLTQREKFLNWLRIKRTDHGLQGFATAVDLHDGKGLRRLTAHDLETDASLPEELFADLNRFNAAVATGKVRPLVPADLDGEMPA